jgi:hypothetical protein
MFRKYVQAICFQRMLSSYLYKTVLNQQDVVELLKNYPNRYEHLVKELLREQGDQSKLKKQLIILINDDLIEIHYFKPR